MSTMTYGPAELRVTWHADDEPYDWGDIDPTPEDYAYLELYGVCGCVVELRPPACGCCGRTDWEYAADLWSIVGDADYHREIERELIAAAS